MNVSAILLVAASLGVDVGWRPAESGGTEYIIQIEPHLVGSLGGGVAIVSDVPPPLRSTRTLRLRVGRGELPREMPAPRDNNSRVRAEKAIAADPPPGTSVGWKPLDDEGLEYLIQIEPRVIAALRDGEEIVFDIRGAPAGVSSFRVVVGTDNLPRIAPPQAEQAQATSDVPPVAESRTAAVTPPADKSRGAADSASTDDLQGAADAPPVDASQANDAESQGSDPQSSPDDAAPDVPREPAESSSIDQAPVVDSPSPDTTAEPPNGPELGNPSAAVAQTPPDHGDMEDAADASSRSLDKNSESPADNVPQAATDAPDAAKTQDAESETPSTNGADQIPELSATDNIPVLAEPDPAPESNTDDSPQSGAVVDSDGEKLEPREVLRPPSDAPGEFASDHPAQPLTEADDSTDQNKGRLLAAAALGSGHSDPAMSGQSDTGDGSSASAATPTPSAKPSEGSDGRVSAEAIPRWGWWAAVSGLFASLGANIYIFWLFLGLRRRYFELLDTPAASSPA